MALFQVDAHKIKVMKMFVFEKTLCYIPSNGKGFYEFHPPKSTAGKRCIPMTKMVRDVLLEQKAWHDNVATRFKPIEGFEDLVFTGKTNRPTNLATIKDGINRLVEKINAENAEIEFEHFTPHCLRHTFATRMVEQKVNIKVIFTSNWSMQWMMKMLFISGEESM